MKTISSRSGKTRGVTGITIHIYRQRSKPMETRTITVHGTTVEQLYCKIKWLLDTFQTGDFEIIKKE